MANQVHPQQQGIVPAAQYRDPVTFSRIALFGVELSRCDGRSDRRSLEGSRTLRSRQNRHQRDRTSDGLNPAR